MENENITPIIPETISRKDFLQLSGKSILIGSAGGAALSGLFGHNVLAQHRPLPYSPPAEIPSGLEDPIILEQWKSDIAKNLPQLPHLCRRTSV